MSSASALNCKLLLKLSSLICTAIHSAQNGRSGICHSTLLNRQVCAQKRRVHPVRAISRRRLVVTLFSERLQSNWSAGASAERIDSCTLSMSRSRTCKCRPTLAGCWVQGLVIGECVFGEVDVRLPVPLPLGPLTKGLQP